MYSLNVYIKLKECFQVTGIQLYHAFFFTLLTKMCSLISVYVLLRRYCYQDKNYDFLKKGFLAAVNNAEI